MFGLDNIGNIATPAELGRMRAGLQVPMRDGMGTAFKQYKHTGPLIITALGALGDRQNAVWGTPPSDSVGVEMWVNGQAADDYLFFATLFDQLTLLGNLANNVAANLPARKYVTGGKHMVVPFITPATIPAGWRVASSKTGMVLNVRHIAAASNLRYKQAANTASINLTGAGASQQLPYTDTTMMPGGANQAAMQLCVVGTPGGEIRIRDDGTPATAGNGDVWKVGQTPWLDLADMATTWAGVHIFLPTGVNIHAQAYDNA